MPRCRIEKAKMKDITQTKEITTNSNKVDQKLPHRFNIKNVSKIIIKRCPQITSRPRS